MEPKVDVPSQAFTHIGGSQDAESGTPGMPPFQCLGCKMGFMDQDELDRHVPECEMCQKADADTTKGKGK